MTVNLIQIRQGVQTNSSHRAQGGQDRRLLRKPTVLAGNTQVQEENMRSLKRSVGLLLLELLKKLLIINIAMRQVTKMNTCFIK